MPNIRFRPHHFLCTVGFEGKGYSEAFVENYAAIARELRETPLGDETLIEVVEGTDSVCEPCPNRRGTACETETKIRRLDDAHSKILGLQPGEHLTWKAAKEKIRAEMTPEKFRLACAPCAWQKAGMCEKALNKLRVTFSVLLLLIFGVSTARADTVNEYEARRDALRAKIIGKMKAPSAAKALAKASRLLTEEKYAEAIAVATPIEKNTEFADHALAIQASASIRAAETAIAAADDETAKKKTDWKKIGADAERAITAWSKIDSQYLYSPWRAGASKEIGKAELALALAKAGRKSLPEATKFFERAFQRLTLENGGGFIRPRHLESYSDLCLKKKTDICTAWIVKFANLYSKNSAESKRLAKKFPEIVEQGKPTFANSKVTVGYRQKDADEEAFDQLFPMVVGEKWGDAEDALKKFLTDYPRSGLRFRARYWLAVVLDKKKSDEAKQHYEQVVQESPLTVYGLLSSLALKQDPEVRFKAAPELSDRDSLQTPTEAARLERAKKLLAANADRLAAFDLRSLRARDSASSSYLLWLASFASTAGAHLASFSILSDLIARMDENVYSPIGLDLVFPVVEWPIIEKQATASEIDPILILSLIKQESGFDFDASSGVGASGYMQLMPFTASDVEADVERSDLLDAETNIRIGTKHLKKLLGRYKGNVALALAAYNAGHTPVDRWIREGRAGRSAMEFIEQIPFKETRDYVATIFRNYVWYHARMKGDRVTSLDPFWPAPVPPKTPASAATPITTVYQKVLESKLLNRLKHLNTRL